MSCPLSVPGYALCVCVVPYPCTYVHVSGYMRYVCVLSLYVYVPGYVLCVPYLYLGMCCPLSLSLHGYVLCVCVYVVKVELASL